MDVTLEERVGWMWPWRRGWGGLDVAMEGRIGWVGFGYGGEGGVGPLYSFFVKKKV